jgi:BASS family bile acid:Na+ symporter
VDRFFQKLTNAFAAWIVVGTALAWFFPLLFTWFLSLPVDIGPIPKETSFVGFGLGIIMLGMGVTLRFADFRNALAQPKAIGVGVLAQFVIMPLLGFSIAKLFRLPPEFAIGLILTSCCPGGTASNVVAYLARANVPLSLLMTMSSTILAVALTPLLTGALAGTYMDINEAELLWTTAKVVLVPVVAGLVLNQYLPKLVKYVKPVAPMISVIAIVLIVGAIVGAKKEAIREAGAALLISVGILHAFGFALGYFAARLLGYEAAYCRTVAIEVGMQNSGLGAKLAGDKQFAAFPNAPVPAAISAVYHCLIGSLLAAVWRQTGETATTEANRSERD